MTIADGTETVIDQSGFGTIANAEVYGVETRRAMAVFEAFRASNHDIRASSIYFLLSSFAAVRVLITGKVVSSSWRVQKFRTTVVKELAPIMVG